MKPLVLSSSSPARRALLARLPLPFICISPDVDETPLPGEEVQAMVLRLAELKAKKSAELYPDALIIGCDQVGTLDSTMLCKPLTHENAVRQLQLTSGKKVHFLTAICLLDASSGQMQITTETYDVYFRELSDVMIENYLRHEKPYHCAGSFQAEGLGIALIDKFQGDDYTTLIGLPLIRLVKMLEQAGAAVL
jgi:septum formation protein